MTAFPLGGWSLKPAPSTSWEVSQNCTTRLMRDDEEQGDGAWSSAVTTLWINTLFGHMEPQISCFLFLLHPVLTPTLHYF